MQMMERHNRKSHLAPQLSPSTQALLRGETVASPSKESPASKTPTSGEIPIVGGEDVKPSPPLDMSAVQRALPQEVNGTSMYPTPPSSHERPLFPPRTSSTSALQSSRPRDSEVFNNVMQSSRPWDGETFNSAIQPSRSKDSEAFSTTMQPSRSKDSEIFNIALQANRTRDSEAFNSIIQPSRSRDGEIFNSVIPPSRSRDHETFNAGIVSQSRPRDSDVFTTTSVLQNRPRDGDNYSSTTVLPIRPAPPPSGPLPPPPGASLRTSISRRQATNGLTYTNGEHSQY